MVRLGIGFFGEEPLEKLLSYVASAEKYGFESVWMSETRFVRDAFTPLAAFAQLTSKIKLATAVINPYTRNPVLTAVSLATLDELSHGRAIFGVGAGSRGVLEREGIHQVMPLQAVEEMIYVVESILRGEKVSWEGRTIKISDIRLDVQPVRERIPVYIGATGRLMLQLAGKLADGVLLNSPTAPEYVQMASNFVKDAVDSANRKRSDVEIASCVECVVAKSDQDAREIIRPIIATYLANFPAISKISGLDSVTIERLRKAVRAIGSREAGRLINDQVLESLSIIGTEKQVLRKLEHYVDAGVDLPVIFPHGTDEDIQRAIRVFGRLSAS